MQAAAASEHEFFEKHGFILLDAPTAVVDWSDGEGITARYIPEIEALIRRRIYPGRNLKIQQPPKVVRRGAGTDNPQYAGGVHQDHGTTAEEFQNNIIAFTSEEIGRRWREGFDSDRVESFVVLDFWRTTNMAGPLEHMPLALCDASSVDPDDIVPTALQGIAPGGATTHHLSLAFNPAQRWFYYSRMTPDEVLVFKLLDLRPGELARDYRACFHTAVEDPSTPADAQPRQSCEHRVTVTILK